MFIIDHIAQAVGKMITQYKDSPNLIGLVETTVKQIQDLEDAADGVLNLTSIFNAFGQQLDEWGIILDTPRQGLNDTDYRANLLIRIAQFNSQGAPSDLINIFNLLMRPASGNVQFDEIFPAGFCLTSIDNDPLVPLQNVAEGIDISRAAGVSTVCLINAPANPFVFAGDPEGSGFGTGNFSESFQL